MLWFTTSNVLAVLGALTTVVEKEVKKIGEIDGAGHLHGQGSREAGDEGREERGSARTWS